MRPASLIFRLCAATSLAGLLLGASFAPAALAQTATPATAPPATAQQQQAENPPERVGWLRQVDGGVSFHTADADQWSPAAVNYPVASGDAFWTEPNASAQVAISASAVAMAGGTELDVATLDPNGLQATLPQGEVYLRLRGLAPSEAWSVQTPRGLVTFSGPGRFGIAAGDTQDPTTVTVLEGAAEVSGPGVSLQVAAGQTATITGTGTFQGSVGTAQTDAFLAGQLPSAPPPAAGAAPPAVVAQMPGGDDLSGYGTWTDSADYGDVWYPRVASGWVPYQEGYWAYVAPWGWTWIDDDPWGFAPFHYGRWVEIGGRWGWTPGVVRVAGPPVYAPALVTFFGVGAGRGTVGWFPLAPQEPYRPWFHASDAYLRAVNRRDVTNLAAIRHPLPINSFLNRAAATAVPAAAIADSRRVHGAAVRVDPRMLASARLVAGEGPVRPTAATAGITPNLARAMHLPAAPPGAEVVAHVAPGPAIHARPLMRSAAARPPLPALVEHRAGVLPGATRAGVLPGATRPVALAAPALRGPEARDGHAPPIMHEPPGAGMAQHEPARAMRPGTAVPVVDQGRPAAGVAAHPSPAERAAAHEDHASGPVRSPVPEVHAGPPTGHAAVPEVHVPRPEVHAAMPQVHVPRPEVHAAVPQVRVPRPEVHAAAPQVHVPPPEVHAAAPQVHPPRPEVHAALPQVHSPRPEVHAPPPQFRAQPQQVHAPLPEVHRPAPEMHARLEEPHPVPHGPPPAVHPGPPPAMHAAAAPHPAPAEHDKRPNER